MGFKVRCQVTETSMPGSYTRGDGEPIWIAATEATCGRCEHVTQSFGTSIRSVRRCLMLMRDECPEDESNFYVNEDSEDEYEGL